MTDDPERLTLADMLLRYWHGYGADMRAQVERRRNQPWWGDNWRPATNSAGADVLRALALALAGVRSPAGAEIGADALGPNRYNWSGKIDRPPLKFDEYGYLEGNYRAPKPWSPDFVGPPEPPFPTTPQPPGGNELSAPSPNMSALEEILARAEARSRERNRQ